MKRRAALAGALLALALAPDAAYAVDPLGPWPGSVRSPGPARPSGIPRPGSAAGDGLGRLRSYEQRNRLEDLRRDTQRRLEQTRLRDDPVALDRARRRWRAEDRQTDFQRQRELDAIERGVDTRERIDRAAERLPEPSPAPPGQAAESREAFERKLADVEQRERLERLRRDTGPLTGPGVRRWPH